jgi:hypothetical protein
VSLLAGVLKRASKRRVSIDVNSDLFAPIKLKGGVPTRFAVQGILAHELVHIAQIESASSVGLAHIGAKLVLVPHQHERSVDLIAFEKGYARGISDFRKWIYPQLSPKDLAMKQKRYFTPDEIQDWLVDNESF